MDNFETINKPSRSRSTYENNRTSFLRNKEIKKISTIDFKTDKNTDLSASLSTKSPYKFEKIMNYSNEMKNLSINSPLKMSSISDKEEDINKNIQKIKKEIRIYNFLMLWVSIIRETSQKITDEMKIPESFNFY